MPPTRHYQSNPTPAPAGESSHSTDQAGPGYAVHRQGYRTFGGGVSMPLYLIPPGKRKGNRYYLVRGEVGGRSIEVSTKTVNEATAERFAARLTIKLLDSRVPELGEDITFDKGADLYIAYRNPSKA